MTMKDKFKEYLMKALDTEINEKFIKERLAHEKSESAMFDDLFAFLNYLEREQVISRKKQEELDVSMYLQNPDMIKKLLEENKRYKKELDILKSKLERIKSSVDDIYRAVDYGV